MKSFDMKSTLVSVLIIACINPVYAVPAFSWNEDSINGINLSISGALTVDGETWSGTHISPSGFWSLSTFGRADVVVGTEYNDRYIANFRALRLTFNDFSTVQTFDTVDQFSIRWQAGSPANIVGGRGFLYLGVDPSWKENSNYFSGFGATRVYPGTVPVDFADATDFTTWSFTSEIRLKRAHPIFDGGSTAILMTAACGLLAISRFGSRRPRVVHSNH